MSAADSVISLISPDALASSPVGLQVEHLAFSLPSWTLCADWTHAWAPGLALICGGDGSGKTTLLQLLAGARVPQAGQVRWKGTPVAQCRSDIFWIDPRAPLSEAQKAQLAQAAVDALKTQHAGWNEPQWQAHVAGWHLAPHLGKPLVALSTGTLRKLWMAAALASGAPLTLLDEPLAGLDGPSIRYLQQALQSHAGDPSRLVLVAHFDGLQHVAWDAVLELPLPC